MNPRVVRLALLAYPEPWRRRYGRELEELTMSVLARPQTPARSLGIVLGLVMHGVDERLRSAESMRWKASLTSISALVAGMFTLGGGLASDSVVTPNVQIAASIHLGADVSLVNTDGINVAHPGHARQIQLVVPKGPNPQVLVNGRSSVVVNTKSGDIVSVTSSSR